MNKSPRWLKRKQYFHLLPPSNLSDKEIIAYVSNSERVRSHPFLPLIHYTITENCFRRKFYTELNRRNEHREVKKPSKKREIFYVDHMDGHIMSYYAHQLNKILESKYYERKALDKEVVAYRRISAERSNGQRKRNKCNIDFAKEAFDFIRTYPEDSVAVLCLDITKFFDSLDHVTLKRMWTKLLGKSRLPCDHFTIYRTLTQCKFIEVGRLFKELPHLGISKLSQLRQRRFRKKLKKRKIYSFCKNRKELRKLLAKKGIVRTYFEKLSPEEKANGFEPRLKNTGIPQGTPISAMLSNLYILEFDQKISQLLSNAQGFYRRYSDDIFIACPVSKVDEVRQVIDNEIKKLKLNINSDKDQVAIFERNEQGRFRTKSFRVGKTNRPTKQLTYLGFRFDGENVYLKNSTLSKYYRGAKRSIRRAAYYAACVKEDQKKGRKLNSHPWIFRRSIYRSKTSLGAKRKTFVDNEGRRRKFWGNFHSYLRLASEIMDEPKIKKQGKLHWRIIHDAIHEYEEAYELDSQRRTTRKETE